MDDAAAGSGFTVELVDALAAAGVPVGSLRVVARVNRLVLSDGARVVVRVERSDAGGSAAGRASLELAWASALAAAGGPVVGPLLVEPLRVGGRVVSVWRFAPGRVWSFEDAAGAGASLRALHEVPVPGLPASDLFAVSRDMLASVRSHAARLERLLSRAEQVFEAALAGLPVVACHGDPHFGNAVVDPGSGVWRWLDWQDARAAPAIHDVAVAYSTLRHDRRQRAAFLSAYGPVPGWEPGRVSRLLWVRSVRTAVVKASSPDHAGVNVEDLVASLEERALLM